jgi:hypothetical protein
MTAAQDSLPDTCRLREAGNPGRLLARRAPKGACHEAVRRTEAKRSPQQPDPSHPQKGNPRRWGTAALRGREWRGGTPIDRRTNLRRGGTRRQHAK